MASSSPATDGWMSRLVPLCLLAEAGVAWWCDEFLSVWRRSAVWGLLALAALVAARQGSVRLLGPVAFYDMLRTARRGRYVLLRSFYAAALLLWLLVVYVPVYFDHVHTARDLLQGPVIPLEVQARLAGEFFYGFVVAQTVTIFLLTPALVAGVVAEEKQRGTLDPLLGTDLFGREVVLGLV